MHALIQPNVIWREGGWLTTNARGRVETWQAASHATAIRGAGVRQSVPLPLVRQIDIAPTIARLLGFEMPDVDGVPLVGLLR